MKAPETFTTSPSKSQESAFPIHASDGTPTGSVIQIDQASSTATILKEGLTVSTRSYVDPFVNSDTIRVLATADLIPDAENQPTFGLDYPVIRRKGEMQTEDFRAGEVARTIMIPGTEAPNKLQAAWIALRTWQGHPPPDGIIKAYHILRPDLKGRKSQTGFGLVISPEGRRTRLTIVDMSTGQPVGDQPTAITHVTRESVTNANMASAVAARGLVRGTDGRTPTWSRELPRTITRR